jgi:hypothetical protein
MEPRYSLRFDSGERAGEAIPIQGQGFTIGRKPGQALQILDNSVSGKHAEIVVDEQGVLLRDLGSTNGTRVGTQRVTEVRLSNGDRVSFGNVQMVFVDAGSSAAPDPMTSKVPAAEAPASAPVTAQAQAQAPDTLLRLSPELIARSLKRPVVGWMSAWVGLLVLVAIGGGLWYYLRRPSQGGSRAVRSVRPAAGNLLGEDFSFESENDGWTALEGAPVAFLKSAQGRYSGAVGLVGDFTEGDWALHRSREVRVEAGAAITGSVRVKVDGGAVAQIGLEMSPPEGAEEAGPVVAWSKPFATPGSFAACEVAAIVPPGYETARLLILGRGHKGGTVAADDAELALADASVVHGAAPVVFTDWRLALLGDPATACVLSRSGRALVTGIAFSGGSGAVEMARAGTLSAAGQTGRLTIDSPDGAAFALRAESGLVHNGLATIAADGYATHGLDFERENATSLLLGKGTELVRIGFAKPVSMRGVAEGAGTRIQVRPSADAGGGAVGPIGEVVVQLDFTEDRRKAGDLAYAARNAEKKGDLGDCLKQWGDLLTGFPYEEQLVAEAEAKRATLVQQGLSELQDVHAEIERARFFRLVDLYRQCRDKARAVGAKFKGSEVDAEAQKVAAEVEQDLVGLEADLAKLERARLEAILAALETQKAQGLAAAVRAHLEKMPKAPGGDRSDPKTEDSKN